MKHNWKQSDSIQSEVNYHNRPLLANTNKIVDQGNEIEREDIDGKYAFLSF